MLLASLAAALLLVAATVVVGRLGLRAGADIRELESGIVRTSAARTERRRFAAGRTAIADAAENAAEAIQLGTATVQVGHGAIAAIPFGVLEAIPATRSGTRRVRAVHDETSEGVYRAISVVSGAVGNIVSRRMKGAESSLPSGDEHA